MNEKFVEEFLILNGFEKVDSKTFRLNKCFVNIEEDYYSLLIEENNDMFNITSSDLNIYFLIGYLTYYNYINRNYKLPL